MIALRIIGVIVGVVFIALGAFGAMLALAPDELPRPWGLLLTVLPTLAVGIALVVASLL